MPLEARIFKRHAKKWSFWFNIHLIHGIHNGQTSLFILGTQEFTDLSLKDAPLWCYKWTGKQRIDPKIYSLLNKANIWNRTKDCIYLNLQYLTWLLEHLEHTKKTHCTMESLDSYSARGLHPFHSIGTSTSAAPSRFWDTNRYILLNIDSWQVSHALWRISRK